VAHLWWPDRDENKRNQTTVSDTSELRVPADKAVLGSSSNTLHLYFDLQGFIYSFHPISTAVLLSPRADWKCFRCYLAVTLLSLQCVVCRFSFFLLFRFTINRKNHFLVILSTAKTNELVRMNETAHQVVIWINHSRSHAQEKAPADGETEVLRYREKADGGGDK